jgi:hypothetical protein
MQRNIAHDFSRLKAETPGAHIWPVWDRNLVDFVQLLF